PGYKLTYCKKCWKLGHIRSTCNEPTRCRICLDNYEKNVPHQCQGPPKCAQCDKDHWSLDNKCLVVQQYRNDLKYAVDEAITRGKLQRNPTNEIKKTFSNKPEDFPVLCYSSQFPLGMSINVLESEKLRLRQRGFNEKECNQLTVYLNEWYSSSTLDQVMTVWETHGEKEKNRHSEEHIPLTFLSYNVQGLATKGLEVLDLIHQVGASFIICTEVGEQYNTFQIPDFNMFHEEGTNKNGGVSIAVGKHLKATKVETKLQNTLVMDIMGLNEPLRVIGIYWSNSQQRNIQELNPYIIKNTIISGDFNASIAQWNSPKTDKRGQDILEWSDENPRGKS
ncbi:unnamed protein product, partial [Rotaria sp. Silwood2]